jgi:hypothetical protein
MKEASRYRGSQHFGLSVSGRAVSIKKGIAMTLQACPALQSFTYERPLPSIQFYKNTSMNRVVQHFNITDATIALKSYQGCLEELSLQFPRGDTHSGTIKDFSQFSSLKRLSVDQCKF